MYKGKITRKETIAIITMLSGGNISGKLQRNGWWIVKKEDRKHELLEQ